MISALKDDAAELIELRKLVRLQSSAIMEVFDFFGRQGFDFDDEHSAALSTGIALVEDKIAKLTQTQAT